MKKRAVLVIAHGSKVAETDETTQKYIEALRKEDPDTLYEKCYLQLMAPNIDEAIENLYEQGYKEITAFPFFLFRGNHIKEDIPAELDRIIPNYEGLKINFLDSIGFDDKVVELILERVGTPWII